MKTTPFNDNFFSQIKVRGPLRVSLEFIEVLKLYPNTNTDAMENNAPSLPPIHQITR